MPIQPRNRNMTTETKPNKMPEPVAWPDGDGTWWLMRYRKSSRGTWQVLLVRAFIFQGNDYVELFGNHNYFPREGCESTEASFIPAGPLPAEWGED